MLSVNRKKCTGCGACVSVCPFSAIAFTESSEGFLYPEINTDLCKKCGKCDGVCHVDKKKACVNHASYSVINKNSDTVCKSSSAGIFSVIAESVIAENGMVFGAAFDDDFRCMHKGFDSEADIAELTGSKYVQSYTGTVFKKVEKQLLTGRTVLFVGTPCQISGLKSYLGKEYENLLSVDFICHGVPSPKVWKHYLNQICLHHRLGSIKAVSFRDKTKGWSSYGLKITGDKNEYYAEKSVDPYQKAFSRNIMLRVSCHSCVSKGNNRSSDLTLGDFWGGNNYTSQFDNNGTSLVTTHTDKGEELLRKLTGIITEKIDLDKYLQNHNKAFIKPVKLTRHRKAFFKAFEKNPDDVTAYLKTYAEKTNFAFKIDAYKNKFGRGIRKVIRLVKK